MASAPYSYDDEDERLESEENEGHKATLVEHLEELRTRIMRSLFFLMVGWVGGWLLEPYVYKFLTQFLRDPDLMPKGMELPKQVFTNFAEPFFLKLKLSFVIGLLLTFPFIVLQLWGFVKPALKRSELKAMRIVAPISVALFFMGVGFAWLIMKPAFSWFFSFLPDFEGTELLQDPGTYIVFILKMMLAFGAGFQLPLAVWFLGAIGILTADGLWKNWRFAMVVIAVTAAIITPSGDAFSLIMMSTPLCLLYLASIYAVRVTEKRRARRLGYDPFE
ncbi:MAG: Sec-independent protein translocase protein TatCy [Fimbriimonadales bacterium]|nr:MAG: twin-arginine translocase subunit TatC [Armatimonadota bacterium]MBV6503953.1 Sec-independent protein translocase protein TatCy [Fimbriimonadales bacterium]MCE7899500.1 twin-arginine translocase subunit TatC [Armatimonadetes bacterium ATM1]MDL1927589.1 twin-arginine translocase subunit TatC [Fimbriimonadia bacterium ATM]MBC6970320.1 twin-arginine translocase subunit TatC [Armatimonadota bacterium]